MRPDRDGKRRAPVSFAQERLWLLEQLEPGNPANNMRAAFRVEGPLDQRALEEAWRHVVERHEALRTTFEAADGRPLQVIAESVPAAISKVDLTAERPERRETELHLLATAAVQERFDLGTGPLARVTLFRTAAEEHVLLFVMHHIVGDGWSITVVMRELLAIYDAGQSGRRIELPEPVQYAAFAAWQRATVAGASLDKLGDYWSRQLAGAPALLPLPTVRPRPSVQTHRGSVRTRHLPRPLTEALTGLGRTERATLFMVLLSGFAAVLGRYADRDDVVVGSPVANRRRAEDELAVGCFVNTLPLRVDLSGDPSFRQLIRRVCDMTLAAFDHQDMPFEKLVEELRPERSLSHTPVFQVMLAFQNVPVPPMSVAGIRCEHLDVQSGTSRFDVTLFVRPDDGLHLVAEFNADLFDAGTIDRLLEHLERLLVAATSEPDRPLFRLSLLSASERQVLVNTWNKTAVAYPEESIHRLFEKQATSTPDDVAVVLDEHRVTYRELNSWANRLARRLLAAGVAVGDHVGIALPRSPEMIAGLLAVLKAGAAYVPLEPGQPPDRLEFFVRDSGLNVVVTHRDGAADWDRRGVAPIAVNDCGGLRALATSLDRNGDEANLDVGVGPGDPAYVAYTSGSTGTPKGVLALHRGAVNRFQWMWRRFPFVTGEVCCQKTALSFVDSVWEVFGPLLKGVPLVIIPDEVVRDPRRLLEMLAAHRVTRLVVVPSLLRAMLASAPDLGTRMPELTLWISSGETLTPQLRNEFYRAAPGARLLNLYGSSEVSADALWHDTIDDLASASVPIGRPIDNTRVYILDRALEPTPVGVPGEIYVGGAGLARAYLNRPELTASKFVPDPLAGDGALLYGTGDIGRYDGAGNVHFLGRRDRQVKVRGYRIELGEVEKALQSHARVGDAAVVCHQSEADAALVGYVVAHSPEPTSAELRQYLAKTLPGFMVPGEIVMVDELPRTAGGKVDVQRLPERVRSSASGEVGPRSALELQLKAVWQRCLGRRGIGVHDDFFALGGHSLLAVQLLQHIEELIGRRLPLATLIEAPTIARQAELLTDAGWTPPWRSLVPLRAGGSKQPFFCIPGLSGQVVSLRQLVEYLDPERPFYGLQARGLAGMEPHACVEDMAAAYLEEIRAVQPQGAYLLGGFCFGASVAFEMARQLSSAGEQVGTLVVVEGYAPGTGPRRRTDPGHLWARRMRTLYFYLRTAGPAASLAAVANRIGQRARKLGSPYREVRRANLTAAMRYRPPSYSGPVTVLRCRKRPPGFDVVNLGWDQATTGRVDARNLPGYHLDVLREPQVRHLGRALAACLDETRL